MNIELSLQSDVRSAGNRFSLICPACSSKIDDISIKTAMDIVEDGIKILRGHQRYDGGSSVNDEYYAAGYDFCHACHYKVVRK